MLASEACALAFALEAGAETILGIQAWADKYVELQDAPDDRLVALSLERDRGEAISLLHALSESASTSETARLTLCHLQTALTKRRISYSRAAQLVARLASLGYLPSKDTERTMYSFAEDLALITTGDYAAELVDKIQQDFDAFLSEYAFSQTTKTR